MPAIDKVKGKAYIWYSSATDRTGKKLAAVLGTDHGNKKPKVTNGTVVVCWGAKTSEPVFLGQSTVLNHPDKIRLNRDKLSALNAMLAAGVNVAPFVTADEVNKIGAKANPAILPVIGRTKYHQGGKGFWSCPTMTQVREAIQEGAQYFQNLIEIRDEFRLHVFGDQVIYAVKKVKRSAAETADAYIRQQLEKQENIAVKKGQPFDKNTAKIILTEQSKQFAQNGANLLVRSNRLGWKFVRIKTVDKALETQAVAALKAIGLSFGAVDCCVDVNGKPWIIEVNTGPGLEETTFDVWASTLSKHINGLLAPKTVQKPVASKVKAAVPNSAGKPDPVASARTSLQHRIDLMQNMVNAVQTDDEAAVLDKIFGRMAGK